MDDDEDFFTRVGGRDNNTFQNASRGDDNVSVTAPLPLEDEEETLLKQLIRHRMNEQHIPDVLPSRREDILSGLLNYLWRQVGEMIYILLSSLNVVRDMSLYSLRSSSCCGLIPRLPRKHTFGLCSLKLKSSRSSWSSDRTFVRGCSR